MRAGNLPPDLGNVIRTVGSVMPASWSGRGLSVHQAAGPVPGKEQADALHLPWAWR